MQTTAWPLPVLLPQPPAQQHELIIRLEPEWHCQVEAWPLVHITQLPRGLWSLGSCAPQHKPVPDSANSATPSWKTGC